MSRGTKITSGDMPITFKEISIMCMEFITGFLGRKITSKGIKMQFMEIATKSCQLKILTRLTSKVGDYGSILSLIIVFL